MGSSVLCALVAVACCRLSYRVVCHQELSTFTLTINRCVAENPLKMAKSEVPLRLRGSALF